MSSKENWKLCVSCGGVYNQEQHGGYYHKCPTGTEQPRDENIDPSYKKGNRIKAGGRGALKASKPQAVEVT